MQCALGLLCGFARLEEKMRWRMGCLPAGGWGVNAPAGDFSASPASIGKCAIKSRHRPARNCGAMRTRLTLRLRPFRCENAPAHGVSIRLRVGFQCAGGWPFGFACLNRKMRNQRGLWHALICVKICNQKRTSSRAKLRRNAGSNCVSASPALKRKSACAWCVYPQAADFSASPALKRKCGGAWGAYPLAGGVSMRQRVIFRLRPPQ